jgi:3-mercaptopyruvate sulfurtransferase SseA
MPEKTSVLLAVIILFVSACSTPPKQAELTQTAAPTLTPMPVRLPFSEAEVLRTTVEEAKAAFDNGTAVIVDVRSPSSFEVSHVAGALNISLSDIELNPMDLKLDKNQWIITYCT